MHPAHRHIARSGGPARGGATPPAPPILAAHSPSWTPVQADINNTNAITLGVRFIAASTIQLRGVAYYPAATIGGTYVAAFWRATGAAAGTLLGQVTTGPLIVGWNYIPLPQQVGIGEVWTAGVWTSAGRYARTANAYTSQSLSGNGITLIQAGTDPNPPGYGTQPNGVFADDPGGAGIAYPTGSFEFADYGVDVWL